MLEYLVYRGKYYLVKLPAHKEKKTKRLFDSRMQVLQYTKAVTDVIQGTRDIPKPEVELDSAIHEVPALEIGST